MRHDAEHTQYVQNKITELLGDLEEWATIAFPSPTSSQDSNRQPVFDRERFLLRIAYWSNKILITRPCLCRIERRISNESDKSINFNSQAAETCVEAARELANLFPEQPDLTFVYVQGPWWDMVHISEYCYKPNPRQSH